MTPTREFAIAKQKQTPRAVLGGIAAVVLIGSWYAMMAIHELGHVIAGAATGGTLKHIAFPLLGFSRTDIHPNPHPLPVAWAGPVVGVLFPLLFWLVIRCTLKRCSTEKTLRFFAGFCLLANGIYLGLGWIDRIGDTRDLLKHGAAVWQLIAFGLICTPAALTLWHSLGPSMGLASPRNKNN